ncbi:FxLYD domain-containing protein [Streptomyces sp. TRM49041]|uniref:FxLYD domain-containing protein n=1 Tax=Streptomyces sp. TRM49041 TaxID=2603216 RepID=UPI0011F0145F|nr:FxLYD domain-containing protein [Streptomyces sp. TRM49041]
MAIWMARNVAVGALVTVLTATAVGCGENDTGSPSDLASRATATAASLASGAAEALESATAEAGRKLEEIKGGIDAEDEVTLGDVTADDDGRSTVEVTARNTADSVKSFAVQVDFRDPQGNLLDVVIVTVTDVADGATKRATARSNRTLSGDVKAEVGTAVRY